jgi:acetyltransferase-like isoleucine patch superfamily enzyme
VDFLLKLLIPFFPWPLKRFLLQKFFGYSLSPSARIGIAWVFPSHLRMGPGARIDHFTIAINLDLLQMGERSSIGRSNWITGFSSRSPSLHFAHQLCRSAQLLLGEHSAITKHHHLDCTNRISIGPFTTVAGYSSQLLTHSIDVYHNRQHSEPINIGSYCFIGTKCVILGGSTLPDHCVLGAFSLLNKPLTEPWTLYAGHPARFKKHIDHEAAYFTRNQGFVV